MNSIGASPDYSPALAVQRAIAERVGAIQEILVDLSSVEEQGFGWQSSLSGDCQFIFEGSAS
jgi:hypothetical protein